MSHRYPTPEAFRQALEQRLRNANQRDPARWPLAAELPRS